MWNICYDDFSTGSQKKIAAALDAVLNINFFHHFPQIWRVTNWVTKCVKTFLFYNTQLSFTPSESSEINTFHTNIIELIAVFKYSKIISK